MEIIISALAITTLSLSIFIIILSNEKSRLSYENGKLKNVIANLKCSSELKDSVIEGYKLLADKNEDVTEMFEWRINCKGQIERINRNC